MYGEFCDIYAPINEKDSEIQLDCESICWGCRFFSKDGCESSEICTEGHLNS